MIFITRQTPDETNMHLASIAIIGISSIFADVENLKLSWAEPTAEWTPPVPGHTPHGKWLYPIVPELQTDHYDMVISGGVDPAQLERAAQKPKHLMALEITLQK